MDCSKSGANGTIFDINLDNNTSMRSFLKDTEGKPKMNTRKIDIRDIRKTDNVKPKEKTDLNKSLQDGPNQA